MNNGDYRWFEEICYRRKPRYDEKKRLFQEILGNAGIKIPKRSKEMLEKILKESIYHIKLDSEVGHVVAHSMLTCFSPLMDLDEEKYHEYTKNYDNVMKKHNGKCCFHSNYDRKTSE